MEMSLVVHEECLNTRFIVISKQLLKTKSLHLLVITNDMFLVSCVLLFLKCSARQYLSKLIPSVHFTPIFTV